MLRGLERACAFLGGGAPVAVSHLSPISDGWETEVYTFRAEGVDPADLVLRLYPGDHASGKALREFSAMSQLGAVGYPVPRVLTLGREESPFGRPYILMHRIHGRPLSRVAAEFPERTAELVRLFCRLQADLHALDWRPFLRAVSERHPVPPHWYVLDWGGAEPPAGAVDREDPHWFLETYLSVLASHLRRLNLPDFGPLTPVYDWLVSHRRDVPCERLALVHGDFHPQNVLLEPEGRPYVIDWGCFALADPRFDLAWTLLLTGGYGRPEARELLRREHERLRGGPIPGLAYFEVLACARRLMSLLVSIRLGAEKLGMRPGAEQVMKGHPEHLRTLAAWIRDRTGITLPDLPALLGL